MAKNAKKPKAKQKSFLEQLFPDGVQRDDNDWIPLSETELEELYNQAASVHALYRWIWALFYEKRKKGSESPAASSSVLVAPFYLLPHRLWGLLQDVETAFKETIKSDSAKVGGKVMLRIFSQVSR